MIITIIFIAFIVAIFIFACNELKKNARVDIYPTLLSGVGVLGTFVGIIVGLMNFDTTNISGSITDLLEGLKTAFYTSIVGMASSMIFNYINSRKSKNKKNEDQSEKDLLRELVEITRENSTKAVDQNMMHQLRKHYLEPMLSSVTSLSTNSTKLLTQLKEEKDFLENIFSTEEQSLFGRMFASVTSLSDKSTKLVSQLYELKKDYLAPMHSELVELTFIKRSLDKITNDSAKVISQLGEEKGILLNFSDKVSNEIKEMQGELTTSFNEFSTQLEKNNVESLVKVMEKVTGEFEKQMNELIGRLLKENFDALNTSVERLNHWQEANAEMVKDLTDKYKEMNNSFDNTSSTLQNVAKTTSELTKEEGKLDKLVKELQKAIIEEGTYTRLASNILTSSETLAETTTKYAKTTNKIVDLFETIKGTEIQLGLLTEQLKEVDIDRSLEKINHVFYEQLSASLQELDNCLQSIIEKSKGIRR